MLLSKIHANPRDDNVVFFPEEHHYMILTDLSSNYTSVTEVVHSCFEQFETDKIIETMKAGDHWNESNKYWGMADDEIKATWSRLAREASNLGTMLHGRIEMFMNSYYNGPPLTNKQIYDYYVRSGGRDHDAEEDKEWLYFLEFIEEYPQLKPYRTEWMIYHEDYKIAGCIDMVYENADGTLTIFDWKRSKEIQKENAFNNYSIAPSLSHIRDSNYWHYSLQLNFYKKILEEKYGKKVREMYLMKLHPNNCMNSYEMYEVPVLQTEIHQLLNKDIKRI